MEVSVTSFRDDPSTLMSDKKRRIFKKNFQEKSFHSNTLNEVSGLSVLSDSDCEALTDDVINYDPDFDLCAGRKEIVRLHTEPVFKVCVVLL